MSTQTKLAQTSPGKPEARPESRPPTSPKNAETTVPPVYWGDRLTFKFWLFCFALMAAMHLVEALHRLALSLLGISRSP